MNVRRLLPGDAAAYRALMLDAYEAHPDAFTSSRAERGGLPLSWWEGRLQPGEQASEMVFGAFEGERLVGVAGLAFEAREKLRHKAHLFGMFVHPDARKNGAGREIVRAVLDAARARPGVRLVTLTVTEGNVPACTLYERCGFVAFGVEPMAMKSEGRFVGKVHMWCDLEEQA